MHSHGVEESLISRYNSCTKVPVSHMQMGKLVLVLNKFVLLPVQAVQVIQ